MKMKTKLRAWPNGMGWTFGDWEIMKPVAEGQPFRARFFRPGERMPFKVGAGPTWKDAILNSREVPR